MGDLQIAADLAVSAPHIDHSGRQLIASVIQLLYNFYSSPASADYMDAQRAAGPLFPEHADGHDLRLVKKRIFPD